MLNGDIWPFGIWFMSCVITGRYVVRQCKKEQPLIEMEVEIYLTPPLAMKDNAETNCADHKPKGTEI